MKKLIVVIIAFCIFGTGTVIHAQNTIPATGGNAAGTGGTASYTVGQVVYKTNTGTKGSVAQGVQQPFEISVITGLEESKDFSLEFVVYPNPATDFIKLRIENYEVENLTYRLYNINGILLQSNEVRGMETTIYMTTLLPSTYFLKVIDKNKVLITYKIIKN